MGKRIACVITNLFEDSEYEGPRETFVSSGHEVVTIGMKKGEEIKGNNGQTIILDEGIDDVSVTQFDALFIPGGFSPDQLRGDQRFVSFAKQFMNEKKPVFAICHGPQLLINAEAVEGRDMTGFKSIAIDLKNAGANYHDQEVVVCQEQLVTSRNPHDIPAFDREALKLLN